MPKIQNPITHDMFRKASPLTLTITDDKGNIVATLLADVRPTTGPDKSDGYYASGKGLVSVQGTQGRVQVGCNITLINSKDSEMANAKDSGKKRAPKGGPVTKVDPAAEQARQSALAAKQGS